MQLGRQTMKEPEIIRFGLEFRIFLADHPRCAACPEPTQVLVKIDGLDLAYCDGCLKAVIEKNKAKSHQISQRKITSFPSHSKVEDFV